MSDTKTFVATSIGTIGTLTCAVLAYLTFQNQLKEDNSPTTPSPTTSETTESSGEGQDSPKKQIVVKKKPTIPFKTFHARLKDTFSDEEKVQYIQKQSDRLGQIKFSQFDLAVQTLTMDKNKLAAARLLKDVTETPNSSQLDSYTSQFSLDKSKQKAVDILYE